MHSPAVLRHIILRRRGFRPTDIPSVVAWWNADDLSPGVVASWRDRIANCAPAGANQPIKSDTSFNGFGGVTGDGVDDELTATTGFGSIPFTSNEGNILVLCGGSASGAAVCPIGYGTQGTAVQRRFQIGGTGTPAISDGTTTTNGGAASMASGFHVLVGQWGPTTTQNAWMDGTPFAGNPITAANTLNTTATRLRLFANAQTAAAQFFPQPIRHILITLALTTFERQLLEGFLVWDGGIQSQLIAGHPYKDVRP